MALLAPCGCPITKTLTVNFTGSMTPPSNGYAVKWKVDGTSDSFHSVLPNPTTSPVVITGVPACQDILVVMQAVCDGLAVSSEQSTVVSAISHYNCGDNITGSHSHLGYYLYAPYLLDVRSASADVTLTYDVVDTPNRISVYNSAGSMIITSGWRGIAAYAGPWGSSLSTALTGTITFTPTSGSCFYKILVESQTGTTTSDAFSIAVSCPTGTTPVTPTITYVSCSGGDGAYRIDAPYLTNMRIALSASGYLTNTGSTFTWIEGTITSSTGPSATLSSTPLLPTSGSASIGAANDLYIDVTMGSAGYLIINSSVYTINSHPTYTTAGFAIINVNGTDYSESPIATQSVCVGEPIVATVYSGDVFYGELPQTLPCSELSGNTYLYWAGPFGAGTVLYTDSGLLYPWGGLGNPGICHIDGSSVGSLNAFNIAAESNIVGSFYATC